MDKFEKSVRSAKDVGPTIRLIRRNLKLTQRALSGITGIKQQTISAIESGAQLPSLATLFAILSSLNLELVIATRVQRKKGYAPGRKQ